MAQWRAQGGITGDSAAADRSRTLAPREPARNGTDAWAERDFDAPWNRAIRYRIADPAQRFYYGLVLPNESAIASAGAEAVWRERIEPEAWLGYVGREVFEDVVREAYRRHAVSARASARRWSASPSGR